MKLLASLLLATTFLFSSCDKKEPVIENVPGIMRISNTGACTVQIQLNTGKSLYPTNEDKVKDFLTEGRQVTISYRPDKEFVSPCAASEAVFIEEIR